MISRGVVGRGGGLIGRGIVTGLITRFVASFGSFIMVVMVMGNVSFFLVGRDRRIGRGSIGR